MIGFLVYSCIKQQQANINAFSSFSYFTFRPENEYVEPKLRKTSYGTLHILSWRTIDHLVLRTFLVALFSLRSWIPLFSNTVTVEPYLDCYPPFYLSHQIANLVYFSISYSLFRPMNEYVEPKLRKTSYGTNRFWKQWLHFSSPWLVFVVPTSLRNWSSLSFLFRSSLDSIYPSKRAFSLQLSRNTFNISLTSSDDMKCLGPFLLNSNFSFKTVQCRSNHCFPEDIFLPRTNHYP